MATQSMNPVPMPAGIETDRQSHEWRALIALGVQYWQGHEFLMAEELKRLQFYRWLYRTGRLAP